jgi:hypothetical protein
VTSVWIVLDEDGMPDYCASYAQACHDHINDAIADGIEGSDKWVVREATIKPPPKPETPRGFCSVCGQRMPVGEGMFRFHGYSGPCPTVPTEGSPT